MSDFDTPLTRARQAHLDALHKDASLPLSVWWDDDEEDEQ